MSSYFSANCREELEGHVNCAKVFLEQHVKFGTPYTPGGGDTKDPCRLTRSLYMRCMATRRTQGLDGEKVARDMAQQTPLFLRKAKAAQNLMAVPPTWRSYVLFLYMDGTTKDDGGPKLCEMELAMHGNCVANQLERTQRMGEKYWTQGGEDKCLMTRANYEQCMYRSLQGEADERNDQRHTAEMERNVSHLHVNLPNK